MRTGAAHVFGWLLLCVTHAAAHHGPEEMIAKLTAELSERPGDADLLGRRATEYRALGMHGKAEDDLRKVLLKQPDSAADRESLARVLWAQGKEEEALESMETAVDLAQPGRARGAAWILIAEWELKRDRWDVALAACRKAFKEDPGGMVDWYLLRSRIEELVGETDRRVAGLKAGCEALDSVVLRNAWVDAALDAGQLDPVATVIEAELADSRLKSSWWIRRGRWRLASGQLDAGKADLELAIKELNRRIHPERPDAGLLIDRSCARFLLGDREEAHQDLEKAKEHGADLWELERLTERLR